MDDEPVKDDQQQQPEYDTGDPEVPIVLHHPTTHPNNAHSYGKYNRTKSYAAVARKWVGNAFGFIWREALWNKTFWTVASTIVMAVATSVYAVYATRQWRVMRDQLPEIKTQASVANTSAEAAKDAAGTARDTLIASNRPWVGMLDPSTENVEIKVIPNPMRPDEPHLERFTDNISYVLKNFGNSPARRVQNTIFVTNEMPSRGKPIGCLISDSYSKNAAIESFIILPHESVAKTRSSRSPVTYDMFNGGLKQMWLSACITYQDAIGDSLHHTWLLYQSIPFGETPVLFINSSGVASTRVSGWKMVDSDAD
jgi:hypothetical protein